MFCDHRGDFDILGPKARDHHELAVPAGDDAGMDIREPLQKVFRLVGSLGCPLHELNESGKCASAKSHNRLLRLGHAARLPLANVRRKLFKPVAVDPLAGRSYSE